jgi:hypothetical protein
MCLAIQFKRVGEGTVLAPSGRPAGVIEERGTVAVFGREIPMQGLVYEGKVKLAFLGDRVTLLGERTYKHVWTYNGGTKPIEVNTTGKNADLVLSITLGDCTVGVIQDTEAATISEPAIAALDQVLSSFAVTQ